MEAYAIRLLFVLLWLSVAPNAFADTIHLCSMKADALIKVSSVGALEAESHSTVKEEMKVVFVETKSGGYIKGNSSQVPLKRLSPNVYVEETGGGNIVLWTMLTGLSKHSHYLVQHKAYVIAEPFTNSIMYQCD